MEQRWWNSGGEIVPDFVGGLVLSRRYYEEVVGPILATAFPGCPYAAALLGPGSEVLGYDTALSADHDWGPRLFLFFTAADHDALASQIDLALRAELPDSFHSFPTRFALTHDPLPGSMRHRVEVHTAARFFAARLGCDTTGPLQPADWLTVPEQVLLELTAGAVYHDGPGELTALRDRLAYYPRDLWLYRMAMQWQRIAQREAFVGRTGDLGDELGSALVAAGIVRDLLRLCFLIARRYAPYEKWLGTAFAQLSCGPTLGPLLEQVLQARDWQTREAWLTQSYALVLALHNTLGITPPVETAVSPYHSRPFLVPHAERVVALLRAAIADPAVRALPLCGGADQLSDSTDFLGRSELRGQLRPLYA